VCGLCEVYPLLIIIELKFLLLLLWTQVLELRAGNKEPKYGSTSNGFYVNQVKKSQNAVLKKFSGERVFVFGY